jgi:IS30 family transposase
MEKIKKRGHFTKEERIKLEVLLLSKVKYRKISALIYKSISSISVEVKRNSINGVYLAEKADHKSYIRRYNTKKGSSKIIDLDLMQYIDEKLSKRWSPERIAGDLRENGDKHISKNCIYRYVKMYSKEKYLIFKGKKRVLSIKYEKCIKDTEKTRVDMRPITLSVGHYEGDFIVSSFSKYSLLVVVDRYTKYAYIEILENRKHATVMRAFQKIFKNVKVLSLTLDNDISFSNWKQIEVNFNTKVYFTYPYHSWEKGLVENTNRWIRVFIPKKSDIKFVTKIQLQEVLEFLNEAPRQILNYKTTSMLYLS